MKADLDFAVSYRLSGRGGTSSGLTYIITILSIIIAIILGATAVFFVVLNYNDKQYANQMKAELAQLEAQRIIIKDKQLKLNDITKKVNFIKSVNTAIDGHRMLSKAEILSIHSNLDKGVTVVNVNYANSVIELQCTTKSLYAPSNSADKLNQAGISTYVGYNGFTSNDAGEVDMPIDGENIIQYDPNAPKEFNFTLICAIGGTEQPEGGDANE